MTPFFDRAALMRLCIALAKRNVCPGYARGAAESNLTFFPAQPPFDTGAQPPDR